VVLWYALGNICAKKRRIDMRIHLDSANYDEVKAWVQTGLIDGVTTNPTHLSKEKANPTALVRSLCALLPSGNISVEVTESEPDKVYKQAKEIANLGKNILVKVPCHVRYYPIIKQLVDEKINLNITLVFSLMQGLCMCKMGVYCISPFVGRLDDIDAEGIQLVANLRAMIDNYNFETELLAASLRTVAQLHAVIEAGADIATLPPALLALSLEHPLTDRGMEKFLADWKKLGITKFPE
jgi:transaldolase